MTENRTLLDLLFVKDCLSQWQLLQLCTMPCMLLYSAQNQKNDYQIPQAHNGNAQKSKLLLSF